MQDGNAIRQFEAIYLKHIISGLYLSVDHKTNLVYFEEDRQKVNSTWKIQIVSCEQEGQMNVPFHSKVLIFNEAD